MRNWLAFLAVIAAAATSSLAHFPFIVPDAGGATARLIMSETLKPDSEVGIEILKGASLRIRSADGAETPLTFSQGEQWMTMALPGEGTRVVHGLADLGYMQRGPSRPHRLIYHPKTIVGDAFGAGTTLSNVPVELVPVRAGEGFKLRLLIGGAAAPADQEVRVIDPQGVEKDYKTDSEGLVGPITEAGRYGAWARYWIDEAGEIDGKKYEQVRHYATLVMDLPAHGGGEKPAANAAEAEISAEVRAFATLPYPAASFGAVAGDGWLYVLGGHTARRHDYSTQSVSRRFQRVSLDQPSAWQELPEAEVGMQGMNLAMHRGRVIRVGGMEPRNAPGEKADSYSIDSASMFDPAANRWSALPALPTPRSSHDVAVVGDVLYVVGGWRMNGRDTEPEFFDTMEVLDLSGPNAAWKTVPQPFSRRALIAAVLNEKVFVFGGFDAEDVPHLDVDIYDTRTGTWSAGPSIPGEERDGFAPAACTLDGTIYLSVGSGGLYRLSADEQSWTLVARTTPRLAHRMAAHGGEVLIIGGASEARMVDQIEAVRVDDDQTP